MILEHGKRPIYVFRCSVCGQLELLEFNTKDMEFNAETVCLNSFPYESILQCVSCKCKNCGFEPVYGNSMNDSMYDNVRVEWLDKLDLHLKACDIHVEKYNHKRYSERYAFGSRLNKED